MRVDERGDRDKTILTISWEWMSRQEDETEEVPPYSEWLSQCGDRWHPPPARSGGAM
tara:strand:- start:380 stop:550 length:171 start_codon:yes stop_codon:yes gene_type:complete